MIHEIGPERLDNQYHPEDVKKDSPIYLFRGRQLIREEGEKLAFPAYEAVRDYLEKAPIYAFSISGRAYFLAETKEEDLPGLTAESFSVYRDKEPIHEDMGAMTAIHLYNWYRTHRFCGLCGHEAVHDKRERMMRCPTCGNMMFPRIAPAIIVAITDGEKILLTKYANRGPNPQYALVAGFVEIGETAEECVAREVMEEVGLQLKNITYYDSQPWGFAGNLMLGYTAELEGSHRIDLDREELSKAVWLSPDEIPENDDYSSLTREMIRRFRRKELFDFQKGKCQ